MGKPSKDARIIFIESCRECPHRDAVRHYTADSFEMAFDWFCEKKDGKMIAGYLEGREMREVQIPYWCPLPLCEVPDGHK